MAAPKPKGKLGVFAALWKAVTSQKDEAAEVASRLPSKPTLSPRGRASYEKGMRDENIRGTGSAYQAPTPKPAPLLRRSASVNDAGTGSAYQASTPKPVNQPRAEPVRRDALNEPLPPKEFKNLFKQAWGERVPNWKVLRKEAKEYDWVVPENPKDVLEHNRLMNRILQQRKATRAKKQELLSGDPEKVKAEAASLGVPLETKTPKHLAEYKARPTVTNSRGEMIRPEPTIKKDQGKIVDEVIAARAAQQRADEVARMTTGQYDDAAELLRKINPPKTPTASLTMPGGSGSGLARAQSSVDLGIASQVRANVIKANLPRTQASLAEAQAMRVGQPKPTSLKKKILLGALIGSPALVPAAAYWGSKDEEEEPPQRAWKDGEMDKYLKAQGISVKN
jgi:hypothetical protein